MISKYAERVKNRYIKGYVNDMQLQRYLDLGAISQDEYDYIYALRHPAEEVVESNDVVEETVPEVESAPVTSELEVAENSIPV